MLSAILSRKYTIMLVVAIALTALYNPNQFQQIEYERYLTTVFEVVQEAGESLYYLAREKGEDAVSWIRWRQGEYWMIGAWDRYLRFR